MQANRDISMHVRRGEIVALLGENGAGKSTLVNQIFGLITPDAGTVSVKGDATPIKDPRDAIRRGIGMVHQHFQLVPVMTVAENMMLGHEPTRGGGVLDIESAREMVRTLSAKHGLPVDPDAEIEDLPVGTQQRVEILKALSRQVDLLILDEPTAVLTPQETDELLGVMKELAASGTSIVFITHKLREVLAVSDRVYVLRQGAVVGEVATNDTDARGLATMMVGREVVLSIDKADATPAETVLTITDLHVKDDRDLGAVNGFTLEVRAGEIVGVAGRRGQRPARARRGPRRDAQGRVRPDDRSATSTSPRPTRTRPTTRASATSPRTARSTASSPPTPSPTTSCSTSSTRRPTPRAACATSTRSSRTPRRCATSSTSAPRACTRARDRCPAATSRRSSSPARCRSSRGCSWRPSPRVASTSGRSSSSTAASSTRATPGAAVLLVSAELDEILSLSDRIAVVHGGKVVAEMPGRGADRTEIGRLMAGDH